MRPRYLFLPLACLCSLAPGPAGGGELPPAAQALLDSLRQRADSLGLSYSLPPMVVAAPPAAPRWQESALALDETLVKDRAEPDVAALAPLLPATQLMRNSRGEELFVVRGAPERHVRLSLDGIPLTLPWDERADLSLVPALALGGVEFERGAGDPLAGPNALAGQIRLSTRERAEPGHETRLELAVGESRLLRTSAAHTRRAGDWSLLAAGLARDRGGWLLPGGVSGLNQGDGQSRNNSDLAQTALLLRAVTLGANGIRVGVTALGAAGAKGVPPEMHVAADEARLWRIPVQRRGLLGLGLDLPLDAAARWTLSTRLSADRFHQEIETFADASYTAPPPGPDPPYETDDDLTLHGRAELTRRFHPDGRLGLAMSARETGHRETLNAGDDERRYRQRLLSAGASLRLRPGNWELEAGGGIERAEAPETGGFAAWEPATAGVLRVGVGRRLPGELALRGRYARRSRFPSLRELYSGALGRFVPNPALAPERQDLVELSLARRGERHALEALGFLGWVDGGIERVVLDDGSGRFRRENLESIRSLGLELTASLRPGRGVRLSAHQTFLRVRRKVDGAYDGFVEDRAGALGSLSATWAGASGWRLRAEFALVGARHGADVRSADGLSVLPAAGTVGLRIARLLPLPASLSSGGDAELFCRVDNLFDLRADAQVGLPAPGRMVQAGVKLRLAP